MTTETKKPVSKKQAASVLAKDRQSSVKTGNPMALIEMAVSKDMDVAKLEKLMELQGKWEAKQAEKAFDAALSHFQYQCPSIKKTRVAGYKNKTTNVVNVQYRYASFEDVQEQIREPMFENGFSFSFDQSVNDAGLMRLRCTLRHIDGHSRTSDFIAASDTTGSKNAIQAAASSNTYMMRYTLLNVLGIGTADDDDDAHSSGEKQPTNSETLNKTVSDTVGDMVLARTAMEKATTMSELQTAAEFLKALPECAAKTDMRKLYTERRKEIANGVSQ